MSTSTILDTVKEALDVDISDNSWDGRIKMAANTGLSTLFQLGVGPAEGLTIIDGSETWSQLETTDTILGLAKAFVCQTALLQFDPPRLSFVIEAIKKQLDELAWRIDVAVEEEKRANA